ncbi:MAG: 23S rRNA (adenine(2503)-C(2))-methyltransferase RlmN [Anaerolineaceae bacterium]|nr:23S rRNA (adenine(2503)-C(2))-methyltransferase RlmN [Anaerolineaceae bacterium]
MSTQPSIFDLSMEELKQAILGLDQPEYRVKQVYEGIYSNIWLHASNFTTLPLSLRNELERRFHFLPLSESQRLESKDRLTQKVLFSLMDGLHIETVLMHYEQRHTVCISSQVGCRMNCSFCATGQMGYQRNLSSGEIIAQVLYFVRELKAQQQSLSNVVVMGMGEPFDNYEDVLTAIDRLNDPQGFNLGARRFTISTVGLPDRIRQFADEKRQVNLAVSLHAATNALRNQLIPVNRKYPLEALMEACHYYSRQTNRRITFEWALINAINDSKDQAKRLVELTHGLRCHVNIILLNPTSQYSQQPSTTAQAKSFKDVLDTHGLPCTIRLRRGIEIQAGCRQLASRDQSSAAKSHATLI